MPIVETVDVTKTYQPGEVTIRALRGISLTIEEGGFVAIAGPSGSGKTTLLNLIGGLDTPDSGHVELAGNTLETMKKSERTELRLQKIGFVFQAYNLIPVLTAEENVEFGMLLQGVPKRERRDRARAMLDEVGLDGKYARRPSELSGGQQQRIAVARAIVSNPAIVLADEPTANLDSKTGQRLLELMQHINAEKNVTFVFSTHDNLVMEYAERLIRLRDGQLAENQGKA
jgi:putative ABC transport system ATP-binding protein